MLITRDNHTNKLTVCSSVVIKELLVSAILEITLLGTYELKQGLEQSELVFLTYDKF